MARAAASGEAVRPALRRAAPDRRRARDDPAPPRDARGAAGRAAGAVAPVALARVARLRRARPRRARGCAPPRVDRATQRDRHADRVDQDVDRRAVAAVDECLVELVAGGVGERRSDRRTRSRSVVARRRRGRARARHQQSVRTVYSVTCAELAQQEVQVRDRRCSAARTGRRSRPSPASGGSEQRGERGAVRAASSMRSMLTLDWSSAGDGDSLITITSKSRYAVQALAELARLGALPGGRPVPIAELARRRDIPLQFLEQLFATPAPRRHAPEPARREGRLHVREGPVAS